MADTTEKKTYLIDIEHNFDEYNAELVKAKKNLEDAKAAVDGLKTGQYKSREEIEKVNTAYRAAQKEYGNAKKNIDSLTQSNKANSGSYNELYQQWQLAQVQLKNMAGAYTVNEKGVRVLSERYIQQSKVVDEAKQSLDAFGKGIHSNQLNVGNYSEVIEGAIGNLKAMPGPLGAAATATQGLGKQMLALLANPIVLIIAGIVAVLKLLYESFKKSQENSIILSRALGMISGLFNTLLNALKPVAEFIVKHVIVAFETLGKVAEKTVGLVSKGLRFLGFDKAAESVDNWVEAIKEGAKAGSDLAEAEIRLKNAMREVELIRLRYLKQAEELRQIRDDEERSLDERIKANTELGRVLTEQAQSEMVIAKQQLAVAEQRLALEGESDTNLDARAEALKRIADIEESITGFRSEQLTQGVALRKQAAEQLQAAKDKLTKELDEYKKNQEEVKKAVLASEEKEKKRLIDLAQWERDRLLENQENMLTLRELNNDYIFNIERARIEMERKAEIDSAEKTGADINIINAKYSAIQRELTEEETNARLSLYAGFAGNLATIFGENTKLGKAAAIAQTTIATYQSAVEAYKSLAGIPVVGPALGFVAAGAAVAAGIANVKKIMAVNTDLKSGGGGSVSATTPTAISSSPAAQRTFANQVGSTILTQPQLSQSQLNALPQNNQLTPESIAAAISKLPAPVVTVEDINARTAAKTKIEVRANI